MNCAVNLRRFFTSSPFLGHYPLLRGVSKFRGPLHKHIYTTNPVEWVNAGIELMRLELGGYFPSRQALEVNLFIQVVNLQDRWWRRPIPTVRAKSYELLQIFAMKYELAEDHETVHNF